MSQRIVLTTTATVTNKEIKEVVDIVSAEVAVGMNIFKDMFSAVRDVVGGAQALFRTRLEICEARRWKSFVRKHPEWAQMLSLVLTWIIQNLAAVAVLCSSSLQTARQ